MSGKQQKQPRKENLMDIVFIPAKNLAFHEDKDGFIILDRENTGFYNRTAQLLFHKPRVSHITLDKYGTALWKQLDGKHDVYEIVGEMKEKFPEEKEKMLERSVEFLKILERSGFISRGVKRDGSP